MIANLFIIFVVLMLTHFIYEGIIAPTLRLRLKYELFKIRDELRALKDAKGPAVSDKVFSYLQNCLNNLIKFLPAIDVLNSAKIEQRIREDENLRAEVTRVSRCLEDSKLEEVQELRNKISKTFAHILIVNNAMILLYVLPGFALMFFARSFLRKIVNAIQGMLYVSEDELSQVIPKHDKFCSA